MKWGLSILALCALLAATAPEGGAAEQGGGDAKLLKMVVLSRHGVRSPTQSSETLGSWSRKGLARVAREARRADPARGQAGHRDVGTGGGIFTRGRFTALKRLPGGRTIAVRADRDQRTRVTERPCSRGWLRGAGSSLS